MIRFESFDGKSSLKPVNRYMFHEEQPFADGMYIVSNSLINFARSVNISQDTVDALHNPEVYRTRFLGDVMVKGKNEPVRLLEMFDGESEEVIQLRLDTKKDYEVGIEAYLAGAFDEAGARFRTVVAANPDDKAALMYAERCGKFETDGAPDDWTGVDRLDFK